MENIIEKAREFARERHEAVKQVRKYSGEAYYLHPYAVADMLVQFIGDEATDADIAAALLHDTVEDTETTLGEIYKLFGSEVGWRVAGLTDISVKEDGNRATRKQIDLDHNANQPQCVRNIKLCDCLHNGSNIVEYDIDFAKVWCAEKAKLIFDSRMDDCHPVLLKAARDFFERWK